DLVQYLYLADIYAFFFFSSRRRHTRSKRDWSSDVCSSDLNARYIQYVNCVANGEGSVGGAGFWNEGQGSGETISSYYGCTTYKTHGGLAISQNSTARA